MGPDNCGTSAKCGRHMFFDGALHGLEWSPVPYAAMNDTEFLDHLPHPVCWDTTIMPSSQKKKVYNKFSSPPKLCGTKISEKPLFFIILILQLHSLLIKSTE